MISSSWKDSGDAKDYSQQSAYPPARSGGRENDVAESHPSMRTGEPTRTAVIAPFPQQRNDVQHRRDLDTDRGRNLQERLAPYPHGAAKKHADPYADMI